MSAARPLVFCRVPNRQASTPEIGGNFECGYQADRSLFNGQLRTMLRLWRLMSIAHGHVKAPFVFTITGGGELVHYSVVLPALGRIPGMANRDLEIGPCWTAPAYRGRGLFQFAMRKVCSDLAAEGRAFWMICRSDNQPSKSAIQKVGFSLIGDCEKRPRRHGLSHYYVVVAPAQFIEIRDRLEERARYNSAAREANQEPGTSDVWVNALPAPLRPAYRAYQGALSAAVKSGERLLDVCCGSGWQTEQLRQNGVVVVGVDIADELLAQTFRRQAGSLRLTVGDANTLPFGDGTFDAVTCAGGFSYFSAVSFLGEVRRVLKPGGKLIFVDSFDENPIYRANRWWHFFRGRRSRSVTARIPNLDTLDLISSYFGEVDTQFFGVLTFLVPAVVRAFGEVRTEQLLNATDRSLFRFRRYAFKIVLAATNVKQPSHSAGRAAAGATRSVTGLRRPA